MNKNTVDAIYHACRQAFVCGQERVPWHMTLHAIREGLNMEDCKTYNLKEKDYEAHSQLRELVQWLRELRTILL
jgi:succinylglutamate desuccinylase